MSATATQPRGSPGIGWHDFLTPEERVQYDRDGFIVVENLFNKDELEVWNDRFMKICSGEVVPEPSMLVMKDVVLARSKTNVKTSERTVTKLQDYQDDPVLFSFCKHEKLKPYVGSICGPNYRSIHSMLINKPSDLGKGTSRHPMHQDLWYFPFRPANRITGVWVALQDVTRENGCLSVIPGSHKNPLLPHGYPDWEANAMYHGILGDIENMDKRVHVEIKAGSMVLFDPLLIHGSGTNRTKGFRKALVCHYVCGDQCEMVPAPIDIINESIEKILKMDVKAIPDNLKQRFYLNAWKAKSRQIEGQEQPHWELDASLEDELTNLFSKSKL